MAASLHDRERPDDPGLEHRDLRLVMIDERSPWQGDEPVYQLRGWGNNVNHNFSASGDAAAIGSLDESTADRPSATDPLVREHIAWARSRVSNR